jgi:pyrroline-5-carboxylate reductase
MNISIIGNGAMATAIAQGLSKDAQIEFVARDTKKIQNIAKDYGATTAPLEGYDIGGKTVILCVKPHALTDVASKLKGRADVLYSVLAGTSIHSLKEIASASYVRAMPNVGASYAASTTTLTGDVSYKADALRLFSFIGKAFWVEDEKQLDIATVVAGCGPAFLALAAEAMSDAAVKCGMKRDLANELVASNFYSFAPLIANEHPALIKDKITSPGGTTIEGIKALEAHGARYAFFQAVEKAYERLK